MNRLQRIQDFLNLKRFAFVGVSRRHDDFSRVLFREFQARGYQPVPVNPEATDMDGAQCYAHVTDIQPPVEGALLLTSPAATGAVVNECATAGITRVWMFRGAGSGAVNPDAVRFCDAHGISVIPGECPFMFLPQGAWVHRLHGFVRKITGSYPR